MGLKYAIGAGGGDGCLQVIRMGRLALAPLVRHKLGSKKRLAIESAEGPVRVVACYNNRPNFLDEQDVCTDPEGGQKKMRVLLPEEDNRQIGVVQRAGGVKS